MKDIIIVNTNTLSIFTVVGFMHKDDTPEKALQRAIKDSQDTIKRFEKIIDKQGTCEMFERQLKSAKKATFETMTYAEYDVLESEKYLSRPLKEITEKCYNDALNILPPMKWFRNERSSMFLMSEFYTGSYTDQYYHDKVNHIYYKKLVDASDKSTWIDKVLMNKVIEHFKECPLED